MFTTSSFWKGRLKAAGIHVAISLALAGIAALVVFLVWYPYPYSEISGGGSLFLLIVTVDVIMGPLLTLAIFNLAKPRKELRRDLAVIAALQMLALAYGLWAVAIARPVHLVYEIDRFRVVHAVDVDPGLLRLAPRDLQHFPLMGPTLLSVREFKSSKESFDATMAALQGVPIGTRPDFWQSYALARPQILATVKPLAELKTRFAAHGQDIDTALKAAGASARPAASVGYLPMVGRTSVWTVLLDTNTAEVIAFVPVDSF